MSSSSPSAPEEDMGRDPDDDAADGPDDTGLASHLKQEAREWFTIRYLIMVVVVGVFLTEWDPHPLLLPAAFLAPLALGELLDEWGPLP